MSKIFLLTIQLLLLISSGCIQAPGGDSTITVTSSRDPSVNEAIGGGGVVQPVSTPSSILLANPSTSPGNILPTLTVGGVTAGNTVKLYADASCSGTILASAVVSTGQTSVNLTISSLTSGTYTFFAKQFKTSTSVSSCSTNFAYYQYIANSPSISSVSLNSGATLTTSLSTSLDFVAQDFTKLCLSESSDAVACVPYISTTTSPQNFTLSNSQGTHTVYLHIKNDLNQTASLSDTIDVDTIAPAIASITLPSNKTYVEAENLDFTVNFDDNVTVTGTPRLVMTLTSGTVYANYLSGSTSNALIFRYTVGATDADSDGVTLATAVDLNAGSIQDNSGNNSSLSFTPASTTGLIIDGAALGQPATISLALTGASSIAANGVATTTLKATVLDISSNPVNGASVTLNIPTNGGTATSNPVSTDSNGEASFTITSSLTSGTYNYNASTTGPITSSNVAVSFTSSPAASVSLLITGSNPITADGSSTTVLEATVLDGGSSPVAGEVVTLNIPTDGGTVASLNATTNGSGVASWTLTSSTVAASYSYTATVSGPINSGSVNLVMDPGTATIAEITTPSPGNADSSTSVNIKAFDANGNLATGFNSNYTLNVDGNATGGGVFTFVNGEKNISITDTTAETVTLTLVNSASTSAVAGSAKQLVINHGLANIIVINDPSDSIVGTSQEVVLEVFDAHGNLATGFSDFVELVVGGSGSGSGAVNLTGGSASTWVNNNVAESISLTLLDTFSTSLNVDSSQDMFFAAGIASNISLTITGSTALRANASSTTTFNVSVTDSFSNPKVGESVTLNIPTDGGSATSNPVVTDSNGDAAFTITSSTVVGSYNYNATVAGPLTSSDVSLDFTGALITSTSQSANATYIVGETVQIQVTYDDVITVTGSPRIALSIASGTVYADYVSGDGTTELLFEYVVQSGDLDEDGISIASSIDLNGGTLKDPGTADAYLGIPVMTTTGLKIDGQAPAISSKQAPSATTYIIGNNLSFNVTFDQNVFAASGTPRLELTLDSGTVYADLASGSGSSTLVFSYTIQSGDTDIDGISVNTTIDLNGATLKDASGNDSAIDLVSLSTSSILIDGVAPTISGTSQPGDNTYQLNSNLDFTVTFNENVTVTDTPRLTLTMDSGTAYAEYLSGSGSGTLTFRYTTVAGNEDLDGIVVANSIDLNGGTIKDAAGNVASLTFSALTTTGILIDAVAPTISTATPPTDKTYLESETLAFTLNYNEAIEVIGSPYITFTIGTQNINAVYSTGDGTSSITFEYAVVSGDNDLDGISIVSSNVELSGGSLKDAAGNDAQLDLSGYFTSMSNIKVDAIYPILQDISQPSNGTISLGENLEFLANFDDNVIISGSPRIVMTIGSNTRYANYTSGSGTSQIRFSYTIAAGDNDLDGIAVANDIDLNGGTIKDVSTNDAVVTFSSLITTGILTSDSAVATKITAAPTPSDGTYILNANMNFNLTYSAAVTVNTGGGVPRIPIILDSGIVYADYLAGSGSTILTFRYTVNQGDKDSTGIKVGTEIDLNGGTIKDGSTADADKNFSVMSTKNVLVDGIGPEITNITTVATGTYKIGDTLTFKVTFDDEPVVTGTPQLILNLGDASTLNADFARINASDAKILEFDFIISEGKTTSIDSASELTLNGGTIKDADNNTANLTAGSTYTFSSLDFDGIKPVVTSGNFSINFSTVPYSFTQIPAISLTSSPEAGLANIKIKVMDIDNSEEIESYTRSFPTPTFDLAADFNTNAAFPARMRGNTSHRLEIQVQDSAGNWSDAYATTETWTTYHACGETIESSCYDDYANSERNYMLNENSASTPYLNHATTAKAATIAVSPIYDGVGWIYAQANIANSQTMNVWVQDLNSNGTADLSELNDPRNWMSADGIGMPSRLTITDSTLIQGRSSTLGLYFSTEYTGALDAMLESVTHYKRKDIEHCHFANINANPALGCAAIGMRFPTSREVSLVNGGSRYLYDPCSGPYSAPYPGRASATTGEITGGIPVATVNFQWTASTMNDERDAESLTSSSFLTVKPPLSTSDTANKPPTNTSYKYYCVSDYKEYELTFDSIYYAKLNEEFYLNVANYELTKMFKRKIDYAANTLKSPTGVEFECFYDLDSDGVVRDKDSCVDLSGASFTSGGELTFTPTTPGNYEFKIIARNSSDQSILDTKIFILNAESLPSIYSAITFRYCDTSSVSCYDYMNVNAALGDYVYSRNGKLLKYSELVGGDNDPKLYDFWTTKLSYLSNSYSGSGTTIKLFLAADGSDKWTEIIPQRYGEIAFRAKGVGLYYTDPYTTTAILDGASPIDKFIASSTVFPTFSQSATACNFINDNAIANNPCGLMGMRLPTADDMGSSQLISPGLDACNYAGSKAVYGGVTPTSNFVPDTVNGIWTSSLADTGSGDVLIFNNSSFSQVANNTSNEYRCVAR